MVHLWVVFRYSQLLKVMALLGALGISDNSPYGQYWGIIKCLSGNSAREKKLRDPLHTCSKEITSRCDCTLSNTFERHPNGPGSAVTEVKLIDS